MELFTEIEFDVKEFDKILKVISRLTQEGWGLPWVHYPVG